MTQLSNKIKKHIAGNKTNKAIEELIQLIKTCQTESINPIDSSDLLDDVVLVSARYKKLQDHITKGTLNDEKQNLEHRLINCILLQLINDFKSYPDFYDWLQKKERGYRNLLNDTEYSLNKKQNHKIENLLADYHKKTDIIYDVFLSFSSKDMSYARSVWQRLRDYNLKVFFSAEDINNGNQWFTSINEALEKSRHFILISTPNSMSSKWVNAEYTTFFNEFHLLTPHDRKFFILKGNKFIPHQIPLLIRNIVQYSDKLEDILQILRPEIFQESQDSLEVKLNHTVIINDYETIKKDEIKNSSLFKIISIGMFMAIIIIALILVQNINNNKTSQSIAPVEINTVIDNEKKEYLSLLKSCDIKKYNIFISKYPNSTFKEEILLKIDSLENESFLYCINKNDISLYTKHLKEFPSIKEEDKHIIEEKISILKCEKPIISHINNHIVRKAKFYNSKIIGITYAGTIKIFSSLKNQLKVYDEIRLSRQPIRSFDILNEKIICGGADNRIYSYDFNKKNIASRKVHSNDITSVFFIDNNNFISCGRDRKIIQWNTRNLSYKVKTISEKPIFAGALSPNKKSLLYISWNPNPFRYYKKASLFDFDSNKTLREINSTYNISSIKYSSDSRYLAMGGYNGILLWDTYHNKITSQYLGHSDYVMDIVFTSNNEFLISGGKDKKIIIWKINTEKPVLVIENEDKIISLDINSNDSLLLGTLNDSPLIKIWDIHHVLDKNSD